MTTFESILVQEEGTSVTRTMHRNVPSSAFFLQE